MKEMKFIKLHKKIDKGSTFKFDKTHNMFQNFNIISNTFRDFSDSR